MQEIKFGISISLSGRYSPQGRESFEGITLWIKDVNQSGGIFIREYAKKLPVELIHHDDESSVDKCQRIVEKLIVEDKVDVLIGPYSSGLTLGAASIAEKYKKVLWNHGGSSDEIFGKGFKYMVSTVTPASGYLTGVIDMVRKIDKSAKKIAIFHAHDSGFSTSVSRGAESYAKEKGFQIINFKYPSGTQDFSPLLKQLKKHSHDIIIGAGRTEDDMNLVRQMIEQGVSAKAVVLVVAAIKDFKRILGEKSEGFLGPSQWEREIKITPDFGPTPEEFSKRFIEAYSKEPDYPAAQGYNIGVIIQSCIEKAGTLDDQSLRKAANIITLKTFYGDFKIDTATGKQVGHKMVVVQWQGGNKVIVYPDEVAESGPIYPMLNTRP